MLILSRGWSSVTEKTSSFKRKAKKNINKFRQQNTQVSSQQVQNKPSSENGRTFLQHFIILAMRIAYVSTHARMRSASKVTSMFENMFSEGIKTLFQNSPQVFQVAAHTLCKINESNNNVFNSFRHQEKMWKILPVSTKDSLIKDTSEKNDFKVFQL